MAVWGGGGGGLARGGVRGAGGDGLAGGGVRGPAPLPPSSRQRTRIRPTHLGAHRVEVRRSHRVKVKVTSGGGEGHVGWR